MELGRQLGRTINIEYERTRKQLDHKLKEWVIFSFYIRKERGQRKYSEDIKKLDNLFLIGIFNHKTREFQEWAYNDNDQQALFNPVFLNFRHLNERKRLLKQLKELIEKQQDHTLPVTPFMPTEYELCE